MRFRNYLGEQYKKKRIAFEDRTLEKGEDTIDDEKIILPITTIYILGFKIPEIPTPCLKVERNYKDLINKTNLKTKSDFVEKLTHDSFIVQVDRITDRYQTRLDKLLSVFEQTNFVDSNKIIKEFMHDTDIEEVKMITDILHHSGTNPKERKQIEDEQEAWRTVNAMFEDKEKKFLKELQENRKALDEKDKALDEKNNVINEKDKALDKKDKALEEMAKQLEEMKRKLGKN